MEKDGCGSGCMAIFAVLFVVGIIVMAIKWFGIPIGLILAGFSFYQFSKSNSDPDTFGASAKSINLRPEQGRMLALGGIIGGIALIIVSATLLFISDKSGSNSQYSSESSKPNIIPSIYQGKWASGGDCGNPDAVVSIKSDSIDFNSVTFVADRISAQSSVSVSLAGSTLVTGQSWKDMGYQKDTAELMLSPDGSVLHMKENQFSKCTTD